MARRGGGGDGPGRKENMRAIAAGLAQAGAHPLIAPLPGPLFLHDASVEGAPMGADAWLSVAVEGAGYDDRQRVRLHPNTHRRAPPEHWAYVFARLQLHMALDHLDPERDTPEWHRAAWAEAEEFMRGAGVGRRPDDLPPVLDGLPRGTAAERAERFTQDGAPPALDRLSLGAPGQPFWHFRDRAPLSQATRRENRRALGAGIRAAATAAVDVAGGVRAGLDVERREDTIVEHARSWFVSEYPLLAALAASFTLVEDAEVCERMGVDVAAISDGCREIYFNPRVRFEWDEACFVMGHELLHAGLRHTQRRQGRDPHLWNVACDYVINGWLIEMRVGLPPESIDYLHDPALAGLSAEEVYDTITRDLRWMRKLKKARGMNGARPDMLEDRPAGWWSGGGVDLDAFYRRALSEGLDLHMQAGDRGLLPAGLVEEIRALERPPIPWDVELAHWLDRFFPPIERRRTFARAHRRQSSTPAIPRPAWVTPPERVRGRTFGVVLDTSGSMGRRELGHGLGAIASYALSRDVKQVRVVCCDAAPHDMGYVAPEALMERVELRGRGGTVLMPGVRMLERAADFPDAGPILIITDGACDTVRTRREHAFLLDAGGRLPFSTRAPVFRFDPT